MEHETRRHSGTCNGTQPTILIVRARFAVKDSKPPAIEKGRRNGIAGMYRRHLWPLDRCLSRVSRERGKISRALVSGSTIRPRVDGACMSYRLRHRYAERCHFCSRSRFAEEYRISAYSGNVGLLNDFVSHRRL